MSKRIALFGAIFLLALFVIDRVSLFFPPCLPFSVEMLEGSKQHYNYRSNQEYCTEREGIIIAGLAALRDLKPEAWTALATIAIAVFTLTLKLSTDRLWIAGERQLEHFERAAERQASETEASLTIARDAARAAERSAKAGEQASAAANLNAQAALNAELPIVSIERIELHRVPSDGGKRINGGHPPFQVVLVIDFQNKGRTVAELVALSTAWPVVEALPAVPAFKFDSVFPFMPGTYLEPDGGTLPTKPARFFIKFSQEDVKAIREETKTLWAFGYLSFRDFMGQPHERYFGAKWIPYSQQPDGTLAPLGFAHDASIPPAYNRST